MLAMKEAVNKVEFETCPMGLGLESCYVSAPENLVSADDVDRLRASLSELRELSPYRSSILLEFRHKHGMVHCKIRIGYASGDFTAYSFDETACSSANRCLRELKESLRFWKKGRHFPESLQPRTFAEEPLGRNNVQSLKPVLVEPVDAIAA